MMPSTSRNRARPRARYGAGKTLLIMLALGVLLAWACVFLIPSLTKLGVAPGVANKLPYVGLLVGAAWGVAITFSSSAHSVVGYLGAPLLVGAVFWFFGLLLGGVLVGFGLSEEAADYAPLVAFVLGAALGAAPLVVRSAEWTHDTLGLDLDPPPSDKDD